MDHDFIECIINHPFEKQKAKNKKDGFYLEESFEKKGERIEGEIRCGNEAKLLWSGSVDVYFDIENLKKEHHAGFGFLEVPSIIANRGIGKTLMLQVIDAIRAFKEYYSVSETVTLSGWLSTFDKENENWNKSVPLYEKVGQLAGVECYFIIKDDDQQYAASEFLNKADTDGNIVYLV